MCERGTRDRLRGAIEGTVEYRNELVARLVREGVKRLEEAQTERDRGFASGILEAAYVIRNSAYQARGAGR